MSDYISVQGVFVGVTDTGQGITADQADTLAGLMAVDATYGTFGEFSSSYWRGTMLDSVDKLASVSTIQRSRKGEYGFILRLNSNLFDAKPGGLQHLLGILCGDLFSLQLEGIKLKSIKIERVEVPDSWEKLLLSEHRQNAYTIAELRTLFKLEADEPLLAFSVKPRMGLKREALQALTLEVLRAGFHIVELDTRNLDLSADAVVELIDLAKRAVDIGKQKHVTRFSPNLSLSAPLASELCNKFMTASDPPVVIKCDGGLDGISTCQSLRASYRKGNAAKSPVITTYPLLKRVLEDRIGQDTFLNALIWSGSDIIYPGGAPNLGGAYRQLDHATRDSLARSVERYLGFAKRGFPMVTVAGGVYAGQLQAYYELLGPNVAYFLGGAVALHKDGPVEGAKLCVRIVKEARNLRRKASRGNFADPLTASLISDAEAAYTAPSGAPPNTFKYISAAKDLPIAQGLKPWFARA
jgi:ribulose 1,5-bisphosphate carboxylase large subunit-like protein